MYAIDTFENTVPSLVIKNAQDSAFLTIRGWYNGFKCNYNKLLLVRF